METVRTKVLDVVRMTVSGLAATICFIGIVSILAYPVLEAMNRIP